MTAIKINTKIALLFSDSSIVHNQVVLNTLTEAMSSGNDSNSEIPSNYYPTASRYSPTTG